MDDETNREEANRVIDALGGTTKVAELCEITPQAVSQWRDDGIPKPWRKFLAATKPDAFMRQPKGEVRA